MRRGSHLVALMMQLYGATAPEASPAFFDQRTRRRIANHRPYLIGVGESRNLAQLDRWARQRRRSRNTHPGKRANP